MQGVATIAGRTEAVEQQLSYTSSKSGLGSTSLNYDAETTLRETSMKETALHDTTWEETTPQKIATMISAATNFPTEEMVTSTQYTGNKLYF